MHRPVVRALCLLVVTASGRVAGQPADEPPIDDLVEMGRTLFFEETFGGNGRTCSTCHREEAAFALPPFLVAEPLPPGETPAGEELRISPDDPLLVPEHEPALAALEDLELLKGERALVLENIDGFDRPPVFRGSPPLFNLALTAPYGLSGEFETLREFTVMAVRQHFPKTLARNSDPAAGPLDFRLPTGVELDAMVAFMNSLTNSTDLDLMIASKAFRGRIDLQLIRQGRKNFFGAGRCFLCHSGPALSDVDESLVEAGLVPRGGNVSFDTGVAGFPEQEATPTREIGREFSTRPLVGVSLRDRFFHDHSAASLEEAVLFYLGGDDERFDRSPAADLLGDLVRKRRLEVSALTAFLGALVPPAPECMGGPDCNSNGIEDTCELGAFPERDCDRNGVLDACEGGHVDCDGDGVTDRCQIALDPILDCYSNGVLDACEADLVDCNGNGIDDRCDIGDLGEQDCNRNGVPDSCEEFIDCDGDGTRDWCQIANARELDCNANWTLDSCDLSFGDSTDCNDNGILDECEPAGGNVLDLRNVGGERGASFFTRYEQDLGRDATAAGDLDGDGVRDLVLTDDPISRDSTAYVLFGGEDFTGGEMEEILTERGRGLTLITDTRTPITLSSGGDLDGDGVDDLVIHDPKLGGSYAGRVAVVWGRASLRDEEALDVFNPLPASGFTLRGTAERNITTAAIVNDLNGDGVDELVLGASYASPGGQSRSGAVHVIFGHRAPGTPLPRLDALNGTNGFVLEGHEEQGRLGAALAGAGDIDGDGFGDLVVGALGYAPGTRLHAGKAYVIFGHEKVGAGGEIDLGTLDGSAGFVLREPHLSSGALELDLSAAGDVDRDGYSDLLVSLRHAYLIFGAPDLGAGGEIDLGGPEDGFTIVARDGTPNHTRSWPASDINHDGFPDIAVSPYFDGPVRVIFGGHDLRHTVPDPRLAGPAAGVVVTTPFKYLSDLVVEAADLNADGRDDLLLADRSLDSYDGAAVVAFGLPFPFDCDADGWPDSCAIRDGTVSDLDRDGVPDRCAADADADGIADHFDNCPLARNPDRRDSDADGSGDLCDACALDPVDDCDGGYSGGSSIGPDGGSVSSQNGRVRLEVGAASLTEETSITITAYRRDEAFETDLGAARRILRLRIGPPTGHFEPRWTLGVSWPDSDDDGRLDDTGLPEHGLALARGNEVVAGPCRSSPGCDARENRLQFASAGPLEYSLVYFEEAPVPFHRGDASGDGSIDIADPVFLLFHLFVDATITPPCLKAADGNDDGRIDVSDPIAILEYLFLESRGMDAKLGRCALDPTEDGLSCVSSPACD